MRSMTGFGAASLDGPPSGPERGPAPPAVGAEIRSVNHKYLQVKVRLPGELAWLEHEVEERVRRRLERGAVLVHVSLQAGAALTTATVNLEVARRYEELLSRLAKDLGLSAELDLGTLTGLPGVLSAEVDSKALSRARKGVLEVVDRALEGLVEMRAHEGAATARELARHAGRIAKVVARIERRMPKVIAGHQQALRQRVDELLETGHRAGGASVRPEDLAREVALIADRMDVSEELARLQSHLAQLDKLMSKPGAVGRALEFLVQEFLREANTVGSKCNDARVAHEVIELKTLIERLREQVMNVE
jgi:uncharacterized protein (TIGR00255 family)